MILDWDAFVFYCLVYLKLFTLPLNSEVSCAKIVCWSFLECISYFSLELVGMFRIFQFVLVLVG